MQLKLFLCVLLAFQSMNVSIRKLGRLVEHCNNFSRIWNCCLLLKMLLQYLVRNIQTLGWKHWKHTRFMSTFHENQWTVKHELNGPRSPQNTARQMCPSTAILLLPVCQRIALAISMLYCLLQGLVTGCMNQRTVIQMSRTFYLASVDCVNLLFACGGFSVECDLRCCGQMIRKSTKQKFCCWVSQPISCHGTRQWSE